MNENISIELKPQNSDQTYTVFVDGNMKGKELKCPCGRIYAWLVDENLLINMCHNDIILSKYFKDQYGIDLSNYTQYNQFNPNTQFNPINPFNSIPPFNPTGQFNNPQYINPQYNNPQFINPQFGNQPINNHIITNPPITNQPNVVQSNLEYISQINQYKSQNKSNKNNEIIIKEEKINKNQLSNNKTPTSNNTSPHLTVQIPKNISQKYPLPPDPPKPPTSINDKYSNRNSPRRRDSRDYSPHRNDYRNTRDYRSYDKGYNYGKRDSSRERYHLDYSNSPHRDDYSDRDDYGDDYRDNRRRKRSRSRSISRENRRKDHAPFTSQYNDNRNSYPSYESNNKKQSQYKKINLSQQLSDPNIQNSPISSETNDSSEDKPDEEVIVKEPLDIHHLYIKYPGKTMEEVGKEQLIQDLIEYNDYKGLPYDSNKLGNESKIIIIL